MKDQCIRMNKKQKVRIKLQQTSIDIFSSQTLKELTDCLCYFIQIKMAMHKGIKVEGIIYQKMLSRITMSSSVEKTSIINQWILI